MGLGIYAGNGRLAADVSLTPSATFPDRSHSSDIVPSQPSDTFETPRRIMAAPAPFSRLQLAAALLGMPVNARISFGTLTLCRV